MTNNLQIRSVRKAGAQSVNEQQKSRLVKTYLELGDCESDFCFLKNFIIGDEFWMFKYDFETKKLSIKEHTSASPLHKKA